MLAIDSPQSKTPYHSNFDVLWTKIGFFYEYSVEMAVVFEQQVRTVQNDVAVVANDVRAVVESSVRFESSFR